ncbi:hypothetical protein FACS1894174_00220 [Bacteroidia bacterium]|nr:hypothetical protein FACS1894174_00220 [Bacteroidia bacterium]
MQKICLLIVFLCNLIAINVLKSQTIVNVTDFGAIPNSFSDATEHVKQAIKACRNKPDVQLIFPQGRYDFWPDKAERRDYFISNTSTEQECPSKIKNIGLLFENIKNLTLEGNGSLFVFHGKMITWALDHCENIHIQNLVIDFERPSMSEMTLVEVTPNHIIAEIHPDSKYTVIDGKLCFYGEGWKMNHYHAVLEDTITGTGIYSSWDPILKGTTTNLEPFKVRIDGDFNNSNYKAGQILTIRDPVRDHVGAFVNLSKNIQLKNLTVHYMHGLGIVSQFSENLAYTHVNIVPSGTRAISAFADGMHFSGCKGNILIDSCHFKGLHDDPVNVHGTYLRITKVHSPTQLTVRFMHGQTYGFPAFFEKDTIAFIRGKTLQTKGIALVKKAGLVSEREMQLELTSPLPDGMEIGDCLENLTWTPSLEVRNSRFERTNTRGLLVTTPRKVVIKNNIFYRTGMYGILIAADAGSWFESGAVKDVRICGNLFDGCGFNLPGNSYAISIEPENHELVPNYWVHRNIRIENNVFEIYDNRIIRAKSTDGLVFENNTIKQSPFISPLKDVEQENGNGSPFKFEACSNVSIRNNTFDWDGDPEIRRHQAYHQTLMMKLFLSEVDGIKGEGHQVKTRDKGESRVILNFEQALDVIRKIDNLTLGIPKIIYLVGWQYNGHDSKYPAWDEVNPKLKRPQDPSALESMKWLMNEAFKYNTTVSVHINMFDAYEDSPLWNTYVENNIIARNADGSLRRGEWGWPVSYTQEWKTGYAQQRIDRICEMLPLKEAGTVHIDAFHSWVPLEPEGPISPYLGYSVKEETETQKKIYRYWNSKGVDITSEGMRFLRISAFDGLQPASWWFNPSIEEYMSWPASYYCGGVDRGDGGKLFGTSMHGEDIIRNDPQLLSGFLQQFCMQTLPWYYLNRFNRLEYIDTKKHKEVHYSENVITRLETNKYDIRQNDRLMLSDGDIFMPALWMKTPAIIAYSTNGYQQKQWEIPNDWNKCNSVDLYHITLDGIKLFKRNKKVETKKIVLSLEKDQALLIVPSGK